MTVAEALAEWAHTYKPLADEVQLGQRALLDTVAASVAARENPIVDLARSLGHTGRWAAAAHNLDFDDRHIPSTSHISAVIIPGVLACGGDMSGYVRLGRHIDQDEAMSTLSWWPITNRTLRWRHALTKPCEQPAESARAGHLEGGRVDRKLTECIGEHGDVIGGGAGTGVAWPQHTERALNRWRRDRRAAVG